jgi:hypothetical protein
LIRKKNELHAAAAGKYVYDGVTIKGDAAGGIGKEYERENMWVDTVNGADQGVNLG